MRIPRRLAIALLVALMPAFVWSADIIVTAIVEGDVPPTPADTVVVFSGIAYPSSQVTIERQGTILATVPADPTARFNVSLGSQPVGVFTYAVYAEDARGQVGRTSNFTLSITQGSTTTVSGIFLGPTIQADKQSVTFGETITILGETAPSSAVTVFVSSEEEKTFTTTAGTDGLWTKQILSTDLEVGDHTAKAKAVSPSSEISAFSNTVSFAVAQQTADPCSGKKSGDINCDGKVNLQDFSILLFYWKKANPANARADISGDHVVNLTDLSILLFNWTG
jgi:hypothetical protein